MCRVTRRDLLVGGAALFSLATRRVEAVAMSVPDQDVGKVDEVAPDIFFHVGDIYEGLLQQWLDRPGRLCSGN